MRNASPTTSLPAFSIRKKLPCEATLEIALATCKKAEQISKLDRIRDVKSYVQGI